MKFFKVLLAIVWAILAFSVLTNAAVDTNAAAQTKEAYCPCGRNYDPVCGSNSITYSNRCEFDCSKRQVEHGGRSLSLIRSGPC